MGWLEGILHGYSKRHHEIAAEKAKLAEQAAIREGKVYETLLNSPYQEIRDLAGAGLLESGKPQRKAGGLAGWMGEVQQSPFLAQIQAAQQRIRDREGGDPEAADLDLPRQPSIPEPAGALPTPPAPAGSASLPSQSVTEAGGPHLTPPMLGPGADYASQGPPPPTFSLAPGGARPPTGVPGAVPPPNLRPGAPGAVPGAMAGASGQLAGPPPTLASAGGAAGMGASPAATPPTGMMMPGVGAAAGPPSLPPGMVQTGMPGPTPAPPQQRPAKTTLSPTAPRTRTSLSIFPTQASLAADKERAETSASVEGWQDIYYRMGDPDWQMKGLQAALMDKHSKGSGGYNLMKGAIIRKPDGTYKQQMIDGRTGQVVTEVDATTPGVVGGGEVSTREGIAFRLYGKPNEDPNSTIRRLTPVQLDRVYQTEQREKAIAGAEAALTRAQYMKDAPLSAESKNKLIETLHTNWREVEKPVRDMSRNFSEMETGLARLKAGEKLGSIEMIRVAFEKMLDPNSVVREGEYARQSVGMGLLPKLEGWFQKWFTGGGEIPVAELEGMVETARALMGVLNGVNLQEKQRIEDRARQNEIDPGLIFGTGVTAPPPPPGGGPVVAPAVNTPGAGGTPGADPWTKPLVYDPVTRKLKQ